MRQKKKMSNEKLFDVRLLQQSDQVEAWVRDNHQKLKDSFCNNQELDDEDYSESMYMASSWALAQILKRHKELLYSEADPDKLEKVVSKIRWKDVVFFLLSIFTHDIVGMLDEVESFNEEESLEEQEVDEEEFDEWDEEDFDEEIVDDDLAEESEQQEEEGFNYYELIALGCVLSAIADRNEKNKAEDRRKQREARKLANIQSKAKEAKKKTKKK